MVTTGRGLLHRDGEGEGEASPLPGYSPDTLDQARAALAGHGPMTPSAEMARFAARLDRDGKRGGVPAHALLGAVRTRLPLSALVTDLPSAERAWARGIRALKVKVGGDRADLALVAELRRRHPDAELRLDANGHAIDVVALAGFQPLYIEEAPGPLAALDESLQRLTDEEVEARLPGLKALILKPMTLGPARCFALAALAARYRVPVTVTHTFDGPLALAAAAALALALPGDVLAVGLDRHAGLDAWPPASIATLTDNEIVATDAPGLGVVWR